MSKMLYVLIILVFVIIALVLFRGVKESSNILPANLDKPLTSTHFEDWRDYTSHHGIFKVKLPIIPQHAAESIPEPTTKEVRKYDMYVSEKNDGSIFMISLITYPQDQGAVLSDDLLGKVIDDMLETNPKNVLKSKNEIQYLNHHALDFKIENSDVNIDGREFIIGKTLYLLSYIAKKDVYQQKDYDYFIDSFQLLAESSTKNPEELNAMPKTGESPESPESPASDIQQK